MGISLEILFLNILGTNLIKRLYLVKLFYIEHNKTVFIYFKLTIT